MDVYARLLIAEEPEGKAIADGVSLEVASPSLGLSAEGMSMVESADALADPAKGDGFAAIDEAFIGATGRNRC